MPLRDIFQPCNDVGGMGYAPMQGVGGSFAGFQRRQIGRGVSESQLFLVRECADGKRKIPPYIAAQSNEKNSFPRLRDAVIAGVDFPPDDVVTRFGKSLRNAVYK